MGAEELDRFYGIGPAASGNISWSGVELGRDVRIRLAPEHELDIAGPGGPHEVLVPFLRETTGLTLLGGVASNGDKVTLVSRTDDGIELGFEPDACVSALIRRHVFLKSLPWYGRLPFHYRRVPPRLRAAIRDLLGRRVSADEYPAWPLECSVEALRRMYLFARREADGSQPLPFWPDGRQFALAVTHDIDSAEGQARVTSWMDEEAKIGVRSCFYVVGREYPVDLGLWREANERGFEVGLHGDRHDHKLAFLPEEDIRRRLAPCERLADDLSMTGFRAPSLFRTKALLSVVGERYAYDSSVPDTGLLPTAANGCATVFPFELDGVRELPVTVPADGTLLARGLEPEQVLAAWLAKTEWIRAMGGAAVFLAHPEDGFSAEPRMYKAMRFFLEQMAADDDAWIALPREIVVAWDRRRSAGAIGAGA